MRAPPVGSRSFCETNPMFVPPAEPRNGTPLVATRRKRRGGPVAHPQRLSFSFGSPVFIVGHGPAVIPDLRRDARMFAP